MPASTSLRQFEFGFDFGPGQQGIEEVKVKMLWARPPFSSSCLSSVLVVRGQTANQLPVYYLQFIGKTVNGTEWEQRVREMESEREREREGGKATPTASTPAAVKTQLANINKYK